MNGLNIDWMDNPGQPFNTKLGRVVHANLTFTFTAKMWDTKGGKPCSVTWSYNLKF
jgi:hypothetical protein